MVGVILRIGRRSSRPTYEHYGHAGVGCEILAATGQDVSEESASHAGDEVPTGETQVDFVLCPLGCYSNCGEYLELGQWY